ncbi:MAG: DNA double-strand break repair nuclease NurA [Acidimicrobiia bacterium]
MRFAVETWDPGYGSAVESLELEPTPTEVDAGIEVPLDRWAPIPCGGDRGGPPLPDPIWFVDGVRRIDARVWISDDEGTRPGVCASVAAGAVRVAGRTAEVGEVLVARGLYTTPRGADPIRTRAGTYEVRATGDTGPEAAHLAIHRHMTELEARATAGAGIGDLVVVDGPLRGRSGPDVVGYVKTQHVQYLAPDQQPVLAALAPGERTPLLLLGGLQPRYSWYLRLHGARTHPLACIVRCEVPAATEVARAAARATSVTAALLRFASEPHKDARAPQNLYPIAGLEQRLRHHLGDTRLVERSLRAAGGSAHP